MISELFFVFFLLDKGFASPYTIYTVDQRLGINTRKCLEENRTATPCKTLQFVYSHILNLNTFVQADIEIIGDYHLNEIFYINQTSTVLKKLRLLGENQHSQIVSNNSDASIIVGNQVKNERLGYLLVLEKLCFSNYDKFTPAAVIIWNSEVSISYCRFINNNCAAINALDTTIHIQNTLFKNNTGSAFKKGDVLSNQSASFPYGSNSASGAVALIFSKMSGESISVTENIFENNLAVDTSGRYMKQYEGGKLVFSHTGGALLVAFIDNSTEIDILISNNIFNANRASIGGGIMISLYGNAGYHNITILNVTLTRNQGGVTGGGFGFGCWNRASSNTLQIINSTLSYNGAGVGGGGKVLFESLDLQSGESDNPAFQFITFINVSFFKNNAASCSGLHLIYNLPLQWKSVIPVIFQNVIFANHSTFADQDGSSSFSGVLLSNRVDLRFEGMNFFVNNTSESALYLSNSALKVVGNLSFLSNHVLTSGGGITLTDVSHLYLHPGSQLLFQDNFARVQGGAMFVRTVGFPDMIYKYNPSCFIQYSVSNLEPSQWNVSVKFIKNGAGLKGPAIFANTMTSCIWSESPPYFSFKNALRWKGFIYQGNYLLGDETYYKSYRTALNDIATDTISFNVNTFPKQNYIAAPGEDIQFQLFAYDELHNSVYSVPLASISFKSNYLSPHFGIGLKNSYYIIQPNTSTTQILQYTLSKFTYEYLSQTAKEMTAVVHFVDSYSSFQSNVTIAINLIKCRPGFVYVDGVCVCNDKIKHIVRCDKELVYIADGYWANYENNELIINQCPHRYCKCKSNLTKVGCAFNFKNPDLQCAEHRFGTLCGKCEQGFGLNMMSYECTYCNGFSWSLVFLFFIATLVVIVAVLVIILNPHFSAHFRGILFFVQMLSYVCNPQGEIDKVIISVSSWIDLGGLNSLPITSCFSQTFDSLDAILLGYLYPFLISGVLAVLYLLHKFHMVNFRRHSPFQSSWILIVAMYKFLVETSLLLLFCVPYQDRYVFFFDGTVTCFESSHLIFTVLASVILLATFVLPVVVLLITLGHLSVGPVISDALSKGLRKHVRWWWTVDFLRRILFIAVYVFVIDRQLKQVGLTVVSILTLVFHTQMQPYRNRHANLGETLLLMCLTLLVTITGTEKNNSPQNIILSVVTIVSMVYCVFITVYLFIAFVIKLCRSRGYFQLEDTDIDDDDDETYSESLQRRITSPSFKGNVLHPGLAKLKREKENARDVIVPSPSVTRSDLNDDKFYDDDDEDDDDRNNRNDRLIKYLPN